MKEYKLSLEQLGEILELNSQTVRVYLGSYHLSKYADFKKPTGYIMNKESIKALRSYLYNKDITSQGWVDRFNEFVKIQENIN